MTTDSPGQESSTRFTSAAQDAIRLAIAEAGGREVFFAGSLSPEGMVTDVRVCARGHEGAVPAVFDGLQLRDVVIHNHPSGNVAPSDADLDLAVVYSHNGHGVYIVDNDVERVYVVIEPFTDAQKSPLDEHELERLLSVDSSLSKNLTNFELRPQQQEMLATVAKAFNENAIAVIEAPTGVGKTLAYLIPAVQWALKNKERVVVSTRTINLQEQIIEKDIPLLQQTIDAPFSAVLVKGRSNYVCKRRLEQAMSESALFEEEEGEKKTLADIAAWAEKTTDGSTADLAFVPPRGLWEKVCSEADTCTAAQCQQAKDCFVTKARRDIAKADIVVVNHHMLFSDLAIKKEMGTFTALAVLPAFERLIIDEAHHIEDSATEYFGSEVTQLGAQMLFGRFIRQDRGRERGLLPFIKVKLIKEITVLTKKEQDSILEFIDRTILPEIVSVREGLIIAFQAIRSFAAENCKQVGRDVRWRLTPDIITSRELSDIHKTLVLPAVEDIHQLVVHLNQLFVRLKKVEGKGDESASPFTIEIGQLGAYRDRLIRLASTLTESTSSTVDPAVVPWIEIDATRTNIVRLIRSPLHVGKSLAEWVYPNLKTIAMTSATLSVANSFDFLYDRIGLEKLTGRKLLSVALDSPFDFDRQAVLYLPGDMPAPESPKYVEECTKTIGSILSATKGHAFVLFTSFHALNMTFNALEKELRAQGITPLKQGQTARNVLLERFRADTSSVLFATDSFWEGVDVAGESLQCVILTKLPFRVPTEPILQARAEQIDEAGGSSFHDYTMPLAVIKFRQGFGRLIRRKTDRGIIVVLDNRITRKSYGKTFLKSLPPLRHDQSNREALHDSIRGFLHHEQGS